MVTATHIPIHCESGVHLMSAPNCAAQATLQHISRSAEDLHLVLQGGRFSLKASTTAVKPSAVFDPKGFRSWRLQVQSPKGACLFQATSANFSQELPERRPKPPQEGHSLGPSDHVAPSEADAHPHRDVGRRVFLLLRLGLRVRAGHGQPDTTFWSQSSCMKQPPPTS